MNIDSPMTSDTTPDMTPNHNAWTKVTKPHHTERQEPEPPTTQQAHEVNSKTNTTTSLYCDVN